MVNSPVSVSDTDEAPPTSMPSAKGDLPTTQWPITHVRDAHPPSLRSPAQWRTNPQVARDLGLGHPTSESLGSLAAARDTAVAGNLDRSRANLQLRCFVP